MGSIAQSVEQRTFNPSDPSSTLGRPTLVRGDELRVGKIYRLVSCSKNVHKHFIVLSIDSESELIVAAMGITSFGKAMISWCFLDATQVIHNFAVPSAIYTLEFDS